MSGEGKGKERAGGPGSDISGSPLRGGGGNKESKSHKPGRD